MTLADSSNSQISGRLSPTGIALSYGIFAALWIVISGYLLMLTVSDQLLQNRIELAKGLAFVITTSALLYLLLSRWHAAVENTVAQSNRALDDLRRKEKELFTLLKVSRELTATLDLHGVLQTTTDRVTELSELQSAAIYLLEPRPGRPTDAVCFHAQQCAEKYLKSFLQFNKKYIYIYTYFI